MRSLAKYVWLFVALAFVGGFLLVETSGLLGRTAITPTTAVAVVNGRDILYTDYQARVQQQIQQEQQRASGRSLTQDDTRRIENDVFDQMVMDVLLAQEYQRRRIVVTDDEIRMFAREQPPDWITSQPELQTSAALPKSASTSRAGRSKAWQMVRSSRAHCVQRAACAIMPALAWAVAHSTAACRRRPGRWLDTGLS